MKSNMYQHVVCIVFCRFGSVRLRGRILPRLHLARIRALAESQAIEAQQLVEMALDWRLPVEYRLREAREAFSSWSLHLVALLVLSVVNQRP